MSIVIRNLHEHNVELKKLLLHISYYKGIVKNFRLTYKNKNDCLLHYLYLCNSQD